MKSIQRRKLSLFTVLSFLLVTLLLFSTNIRPGFASPGGSTASVQVPLDTEVFDGHRFQQKLVQALGTEWVGYQYVINEQGQAKYSGIFGKRIAGADGDVPQDIRAPMYTGSIGKLFTAVAVLKVLDEYGQGAAQMLDTPVAPFFPSNWKQGFNVNRLTFKQLLQHRTGVRSRTTGLYLALKYLVAGGVASNKAYVYSNANYGLFRVILPMILGEIKSSDFKDDELMEAKTKQSFVNYLQSQIFIPNGIIADVKPFGISPALYYRYSDDLSENHGYDMSTTDLDERLGGGGWFISAFDLAKFLALLNHSEKILSAQTRQLLYEHLLGLSDEFPPSRKPKAHGIYYTKGGSYGNLVEGERRGSRAIVGIFPQTQTEVVILFNSSGGENDNPVKMRNIIFSSYDAAWVKAESL